MKPTPNDTKTKQFFTALSMTFLFALGIAFSCGLYALAASLKSSGTAWVQVCGNIVYAAFWLSVVVFVVMSVLSMLDWMRSTTKRVRTCIHHHHEKRLAHHH